MGWARVPRQDTAARSHGCGTCLSFEGNVDHYRIRGIDGKLSIDEEVFFDSLEELIAVGL